MTACFLRRSTDTMAMSTIAGTKISDKLRDNVKLIAWLFGHGLNTHSIVLLKLVHFGSTLLILSYCSTVGRPFVTQQCEEKLLSSISSQIHGSFSEAKQYSCVWIACNGYFAWSRIRTGIEFIQECGLIHRYFLAFVAITNLRGIFRRLMYLWG